MHKIVYENGVAILEPVILTKEETIKLHQDMWRWIAEEMRYYSNSSEVVLLLKSKYLYKMGYTGVYLDCFCCEYKSQNALGDCHNACPFNWSDCDEFTSCMLGYYGDLRNCKDNDKAYELALKIAMMPARINI